MPPQTQAEQCFATSGGGAKSLCVRLVASLNIVEVRCKNPAISTFALFLINEKWKVENGKFLQSLPLSLGEDRMLNERKRINSILGEGSSCRVKLSLLLLAGEGWDEVDARCLFITPPAIVVRYTHTIASSPSKEEFVACGDKVNILHDIYKNFSFSIFNFPFITKHGGCKSLHFNLSITNTGLEVRYKSLHFNLGIANTNMEVGCKSLHDKLVDLLIGLEVRYKNA